MTLTRGAISAVLSVCLSVCALAQTGSGIIQGTVKDAAGAVVPRADITITQAATGRDVATVTNSVGFYSVPGLAPGSYKVGVSAPGMEKWTGDLNLLAGQTAVVDLALKIGGTASSVTVAGDVTPLVTTTSPTLATIVERERIEQLPLNGRYVTTLIQMTTPGVEAGSVPRVYGLRYASELTQDGVTLMNRDNQGTPVRPPGLDTVGEFRSETSNSSAKLSRPATFILTTKSGTNEFHGSIFETHRNSGLGVARARQDFYDKPPHLVRNEYGASVGGPVWIPKLYNGKNRTFFFVAYEGFQLRQASTRDIAVPTAAMRAGDFSNLVDAQNRLYTIYDPNTTSATWGRLPFPGNIIPSTRQSPLSKYLYSVTPMPTRADNPLAGSNWFGTGINNTKQHTETYKVDHRLRDSTQLSFRYTHSPSYGERTNDPWQSGTTGSPMTTDNKANAFVDAGENDNGLFNMTHSFSPTFFSETLFSVSRDYRMQAPYTGSEEISSTLGLPNPFGGIGFPRIQYSLRPGAGGMSYDSSINPNFNLAKIYTVDQHMTKIAGRHEILFGGRIRYESLDNLSDQQIQQGQILFNNVAPTGLYDPTSGSAYSAVPYSGHTAANFYLGLGSYTAQFNRSWYNLRNSEKSLYIQDNFKVNSRLMLNFGLRWEYNSPINEKNDAMIGFDRASKSVILPNSLDVLAKQGNVLPSVANAYQALGVTYTTPEKAGLPRSLVRSNFWDFGPRLGFAYRLGSSARPTVVRGGYSIYAFPESLRLFNGLTYSTLPTRGTITTDPNQAALSPDGLPNYLLRSVPTVIAGVNSSNILNPDQATGITRGSGAVSYLDPNQPTARAAEWNFTIEREILNNMVLKLGYVGTHGFRMAQWSSYNNNPPDYVWYSTTRSPLPTGAYSNVARRPYDQNVYGTVQVYQKTGWSNNNSFQVELERRYSKGVAFQFFYVMSNAMRVAGDGWRDDTIKGVNEFMPGTVPTDEAERNRLLYYRRDTTIPKHRASWNFLVDLPFGRGKRFGGNVGRALDTLIGGWQVAGSGTLSSRYFQLSTANWGETNPIEIYGKKYPIQDCRTGVCYDGWLYFNGYIPANRINSVDANGKPNGVMGVPDSYKPFQKPIIATPANGGSPSDPNYAFYETNNVWVPLNNGTSQRVGLNPGLHPLQNQYLLGPVLWSMTGSLFKTVKLSERMNLRVNADFLDNVFNMPGTTLPAGTDGIILNRTSANSPRVLQLTMRLTF